MNVSVIAAIVIFIAVVLFWLVMSYKGFANLRNSAAEAFAAVEMYMKKRRGLVPALVKQVRKYAPEQQDVLQNVSDAKNLAKKAESTEEKIRCEYVLTETLETLFAAAEEYPKLMEDKTFNKMRSQIRDAEKNMVSAGKFYNTIVKMMNKRIHSLPSNLIAKMFHFKDQPML